MLNEREKGRTTCLIKDIIIILYFNIWVSLARRGLLTLALAALLIILQGERGGSVGLLDDLALALQLDVMAHVLHHVGR